MSNRPRLYDLCCKAGGCTKGYQNAGFYVVGVDIEPQANYCGDEFIQMDGLEFLKRYLNGEFPEAEAFACSPPCQGYSITNNIWSNKHPMLIEPFREALINTGKPYVIENVPGAPLNNPIELTGMMFGLRVIRKRLFETSFFTLGHPPIKRPPAGSTNAGKGYSSHKAGASYISVAGHNFNRADGAAAMGIDWYMTREEVANAIPPIYTQWIGERLLESMAVTA